MYVHKYSNYLIKWARVLNAEGTGIWVSTMNARSITFASKRFCFLLHMYYPKAEPQEKGNDRKEYTLEQSLSTA